MPFVTNTEKKTREVHKCAPPEIRKKDSYYGYRTNLTVANGTIWECDECHNYWRAKERLYTSSSPWIRIHIFELWWYAKIIKHELAQRKAKKNESK